MSTTNYTNPIDLYRQGCAILADHLGLVDSVRFLRLLDKGSGDYTASRQNQPDEGTMAELCTEIRANKAHRDVGAKVRQTIKELGGTMPEELPTTESIKKLESKAKKLLKKPKS